MHRDVPVTLEKRAASRGDRFIITAKDNYILIPAKLAGPLREAKHWVETFLDSTGTSPEGSDIVYFPVKSFTVQNDANNVYYGIQGAGEPTLVTYDPLDPTGLVPNPPTNIRIVSEAEVDAKGTGSGEFSPAQTAIYRYFLTANNPLNQPLYLTANLNRAINTYPAPSPGRVRAF
jgi:hypothetical protein